MPETSISRQPIVNTGVLDFEGQYAIHIMSKLINGFLPYGKGCKSFYPNNPNPDGILVLQNGKKIKEKGLGHILAVASFINDIDCIGGSGGNIGFKIENDYAYTIKIDPGYAFSDLKEFEQPEGRNIRTTVQDWVNYIICFDKLPKSTQLEFLITLHEIKNTTKATIEGFFLRKGAENFIQHSAKTAQEFADILLIRQAILVEEYKTELANSIKQYEEWLASFQDKLGQEGKIKEKELKALQQQLFYYIECDAIVNDKRKPISYIFQQFLYSKDRVLLIFGSSGTGKSLSLIKLHWDLIEKRRTSIHSSDSIFIALKSYNHFNVIAKIEEKIFKLKDKCVLIMDGYDEIGGNYKGNIYAQLQLEKYPHLKIIISCRTQMICQSKESDTWFSPTEGKDYFQKYELQPFDAQQKGAFIDKYCSIEKRDFTAQDYKQHIANIELLGIPDLLSNPFILRLVVESLKEIILFSKKENKITKTMIYKSFVISWFTKEMLRLEEQFISGNNPILEFEKLSKKMAFEMFINKEMEISKGGSTWFTYIQSERAIMSGCPIISVGEDKYGFIHKSFRDYFAFLY